MPDSGEEIGGATGLAVCRTPCPASRSSSRRCSAGIDHLRRGCPRPFLNRGPSAVVWDASVVGLLVELAVANAARVEHDLAVSTASEHDVDAHHKRLGETGDL